MFRKLFAAVGIDNATVDTQIFNNQVFPAQEIKGKVIVCGGATEQVIEHLTLSVMTRVEVESGDNEYTANQVIQKLSVSGRFTISAYQELEFPFSFQLHPETPVTNFAPFGITFSQSAVWIHTDLGIEWAKDATDEDWLFVSPTPAMQYIHNAMKQLGYTLHTADVERGTLGSSGFYSSIGCYQEFEYRAGWSNALGFKEVEISYITMPYETCVVIEADRTWRSDLIRSCVMRNNELSHKNWANEIQQALYK